MNRSEICEVYCVLEWDWNKNGWLQERPSNQRRSQSTSCQLSRMKFKPHSDLSYDSLNLEQKELYHELEGRYELDSDLVRFQAMKNGDLEMSLSNYGQSYLQTLIKKYPNYSNFNAFIDLLSMDGCNYEVFQDINIVTNFAIGLNISWDYFDQGAFIEYHDGLWDNSHKTLNELEILLNEGVFVWSKL